MSADDDEEPVLTTRIDGEEVRLLVHIERVKEPEQGDEDPAPFPE